jgi:malate/lactate dehydrogenase
MRLGVIGSGNVAAVTLLHLLSSNEDHDIVLVARSRYKALAALLDAASAFPQQAAERITLGTIDSLRSCDVLLICAGIQMGVEDTPKTVLKQNAMIVRDCLDGGLSDHAHIVLVGTPVDDLTAIVVEAGFCDRERVIGFGGDLDTARLRYALAQDLSTHIESAICIGEHGSRTIPVYNNEENYQEITNQVRGLLKKVTSAAGPPRNLATGVWLSKLALALAQDAVHDHVVCGYIPEYDLCLTWPHKISARGLISASHVSPGAAAQSALEDLIRKKRAELMALRTLSKTLFVH